VDIVQRNLFRLLRSGAFHTTEEIEPMSVFKWGRLYQLSVMHTIVPYVYEGINRSRSQFFLHLSTKQEEEWTQAVREDKTQSAQQNDEMEEDELLRPDRLTNPLLNRRLQAILDDEHSDITTRQLLLILIRIVRHLFNEGMPIRQLTELGIFLRNNQDRIDYVELGKWIDRLHLTQMTQLISEFLIKMFGFEEDEISFFKKGRKEPIEEIAQELIEFTNTRSQNWYFSQQDGGIFVHNSNSSATFSHVRRSARYFRYYPSESVTNFFSSFLHSLSHIEE